MGSSASAPAPASNAPVSASNVPALVPSNQVNSKKNGNKTVTTAPVSGGRRRAHKHKTKSNKRKSNKRKH